MRATAQAHRMLAFSALAAIVVAVLALPSRASADRFRPIYFGFGGGLHADLDCCEIHGRAQAELGWHFGGEDTGFVMAVEAIGTFGPQYWMFLGGLRLGGDIEVHGNRRFGIILRPSGLFGVGARDFDDRTGLHGFLVLQPAFDIRFAVADRAIVLWLRPVAFDIRFHWYRPGGGDWYTSAAYQALAGIDFQF
jgi:hypothetical protein